MPEDVKPPDFTEQLDPEVVKQIIHGMTAGSVPPTTELQDKVNKAKATQSEALPQPSMPDTGGANSNIASGLASIVSSLAPSNQAAIQQQRQQEAGEQQIADRVPSPRPIAFDLINALTGKNIGGNPSNIPGYQGPSRTDHFENFLSNFITALGSGFAGMGHGPGSGFRGAGAAVQAPYQQALQQYQLGQQNKVQQAQIDIERAKVKAMTPSISVTDPSTGSTFQVPPSDIGRVLAAGYRLAGQQVTAQSRKDVANIQAENRLDVEAMKTHLLQGTASKFIPDVDEKGNRFYHVYNKFGKEIGRADVNAIPQFTGKTTSTYDLKKQEDGSYIRIPKVTQNIPLVPNKGSSTPGAGGVPASAVNKGGKKYWGTGDASAGVDKMAAVPVLDAKGNPVFSEAPSNIMTMAYTAKATLPHIPEILQEIDELDKMGVLGQFKGKMTDFLTKKGFAVPGMTAEQRQAIGKFVDDIKLMDSAMLRTHFGARGGQQMYDKFSEMLNAGEDVDIMKGGLSSFEGFLTGYGEMTNQQTRAASGRGSSPSSGGQRKYSQDNPFAK